MEILPDSTGHVAGQRSHLVAPEPNGDPSPPPRRPKLSWKRVAVAALAAFGIAAVALTTFELVTGHALSGGQGTTIQQVSEGKPAKESDTKKKAPSKEPTNKATTTKSETPTTEPSEAASSEPTETETTTEPTPEAQATTAPETTPSSSR
jgi:type IV secretory pathway VirB10-like protein